jgi:hypothetical protein
VLSVLDLDRDLGLLAEKPDCDEASRIILAAAKDARPVAAKDARCKSAVALRRT